MAESALMVKSKAFALEVIRSCRVLREAKCEGALINQFLRSGTSIGANVREAFYAQGRADFIAKLHIALKECSETEYWLELLIESGYYSDRTILDRCIEIKNLFHHLIRQKKMIMRNGANRIFHFIISIQKPYFKNLRKELKYGQCGNI